jgi:hypothetical protein
MQTPHEITDQKHFEELRDSMEQNGWQGMPLVKWGDECLMTGSHRYPAAKALDWVDYEIPMIDLEDVFAEAGLDFAELHEMFRCPTWDEIWGSGLLYELPNEIREKYGIQF